MFITNVRDFLWEEDRLCLSYKSFSEYCCPVKNYIV